MKGTGVGEFSFNDKTELTSPLGKYTKFQDEIHVIQACKHQNFKGEVMKDVQVLTDSLTASKANTF